MACRVPPEAEMASFPPDPVVRVAPRRETPMEDEREGIRVTGADNLYMDVECSQEGIMSGNVI